MSKVTIIALLMLYFALLLVQKTRTTLSTNQIQFQDVWLFFTWTCRMAL